MAAINYPRNHSKQLHAGIYPGSTRISVELAKLAAAFQADATVKIGGDRIVWKLKKERKRTRLRGLFETLGLAYKETPTGDGQVTISTRISLIAGLTSLIDVKTKTFTAVWREVEYAQRVAFLKETAWWDGRRNGAAAWSYFSTNCANIELISELAAISGFRANIHWDDLPSGKKFGTVNMRYACSTWVDTFRREEIPYGGMVYCVTVPSGIIIVRRNGKIMVTGQSQQEPRILAHFEDGELLRQYRENPWIDYHDNAKEHLERIFNKPFQRKPVKNINLGIIYGQGVPSLAVKNHETVEATRELRDAVYSLYPGLRSMYNDMRMRAKLNQPIRTWGGRVYYCEPPKFIDGKLRTFDYKMLNTLIQGSAADCTKEAIIRYYRVKPNGYRLLLLVHDELVTSVPKREIDRGQELLRASMESVEFDVLILSEGEWSNENWAEMEKYDKKGVRVPRNPLKVKTNGQAPSKPDHRVVSEPIPPIPAMPPQAKAVRHRQNPRAAKPADGTR